MSRAGLLLQSLPKAADLAVIWGTLLCKNYRPSLRLVFPKWEGWLSCCSGIISHTDGFGDRLEATAFIDSGAGCFTTDCLFTAMRIFSSETLRLSIVVSALNVKDFFFSCLMSLELSE